MFVRRRLSLLAVVAGLIGTTSCSGADKPKTLPPLTPSPTPSAAESASVTGAEATVRLWFSTIDGPTTLAAASTIDSITTPDCKCRNVAASIRAAVAAHRHYSGKTILRSIVSSPDGTGLADVLLQYDYTAGGLQDEQGHYVTRQEAREDVKADFRLRLDAGHWLIKTILNISPGVRP